MERAHLVRRSGRTEVRAACETAPSLLHPDVQSTEGGGGRVGEGGSQKSPTEAVSIERQTLRAKTNAGEDARTTNDPHRVGLH